MATSSVASRRDLIRVAYWSLWCYTKNCYSWFEDEKLVQGHWGAEIIESPYSVLINDQMVGQILSTEWLTRLHVVLSLQDTVQSKIQQWENYEEQRILSHGLRIQYK